MKNGRRVEKERWGGGGGGGCVQINNAAPFILFDDVAVVDLQQMPRTLRFGSKAKFQSYTPPLPARL